MEIPVTLPLDSDGFLRRECPTCEREFKWFSHQVGDTAAEVVDQYFCPRCGVASGVDSWWTPAQLEYAKGQAGPAIDRLVQDELKAAFKGNKNIKFETNRNFSLNFDAPPSPAESNDMVIIEPPCHPNEPLKVPEVATGLTLLPDLWLRVRRLMTEIAIKALISFTQQYCECDLLADCPQPVIATPC